MHTRYRAICTERNVRSEIRRRDGAQNVLRACNRPAVQMTFQLLLVQYYTSDSLPCLYLTCTTNRIYANRLRRRFPASSQDASATRLILLRQLAAQQSVVAYACCSTVAPLMPPREADDVSYITDSGEVTQEAVEPEPKAAMRDTSVTT